LQREAFKNAAEGLLTYQQRFGHDREWQDYLSKYREGLHVWARELGISRTYLFKPDQMRDSWPTPGRMIYGGKKRKKPPFLRGVAWLLSRRYTSITTVSNPNKPTKES